LVHLSKVDLFFRAAAVDQTYLDAGERQAGIVEFAVAVSVNVPSADTVESDMSDTAINAPTRAQSRPTTTQ
jgi:hypothetical protein